MSGYELEELESQLNDSQDAEPAAHTPEADVELQVTKLRTEDAANGNRRSGVKDVASDLRKQADVGSTTPRMNGSHGKRHVEDMDFVVVEGRASEFTNQAELVANAVNLPAQKKVATSELKLQAQKHVASTGLKLQGVAIAELKLQAQKQVATTELKLQEVATTELNLRAQKQVATIELSKDTGLGTEARQSPVIPDKNHVKELEENQFAPTEASERDKDCCIEPVGEHEVAEDIIRPEPSIEAVKDNGAGSCSSMRKAPPDADGRRKILPKDELPSSYSPKDQFQVLDKAPTERASLSSKKRKSSVGGSEEEGNEATSSKKAKDDDDIQSSSGVVTDETENLKSKPGGLCAANEASPVGGEASPAKTPANRATKIVVVDLSDDSREDQRKRKPKCRSSRQKKCQAKVREEPKPDLKKSKIQSRKPNRWFAVGGHTNEKQRYIKIIRQLGGECKESHVWREQTTHSVMLLRRTEKVFAAAAAGRWILKPEYLEASEKAGHFVNEEEYEYKGPGCNPENTIELQVPRKWRRSKELTGCGAFQGMRVVVYGECTVPRLGTLKQAIKAGGGCVLAAHPPYHCYLARGIDYAICGDGIPEDDHWIVQFRKHKVACVREEYMVDFVCKPSFSLEKHVLYGTDVAEAAARARLERIKAEMRAKNEKQEAKEEEEEEADDYPCVVCKKRDSEELMLLCGDGEKRGCNMAMHTFCCDPPMDKVPQGDWYCTKCSQVLLCC